MRQIGRKLRFVAGNTIPHFSNFEFVKGLPSSVEFTVGKSTGNPDEYWLRSDGYGSTAVHMKYFSEGDIRYSVSGIMIISENMMNHGGNFVKCLGKTLRAADSDNRRILAQAFSEYFKTYYNWGETNTD